MTSIVRNNVRLTERQDEIFRLVLAGKQVKQMAAELNISMSTVGSQLMWIRKKFNVKTTRELMLLGKASPNVSAELAMLRADAAGFDAWRKTLIKEISIVTAQRDEYKRQLEELKAIPAVQVVLSRINGAGRSA